MRLMDFPSFLGGAVIVACLFCVGFALFTGLQLFVPGPDHGHDCFIAESEESAKIAIMIIEHSKARGKKHWKINSGPTRQILFRDRKTVVMWFVGGDGKLPPKFPPPLATEPIPALSLPVKE